MEDGLQRDELLGPPLDAGQVLVELGLLPPSEPARQPTKVDEDSHKGRDLGSGVDFFSAGGREGFAMSTPKATGTNSQAFRDINILVDFLFRGQKRAGTRSFARNAAVR